MQVIASGQTSQSLGQLEQVSPAVLKNSVLHVVHREADLHCSQLGVHGSVQVFAVESRYCPEPLQLAIHSEELGSLSNLPLKQVVHVSSFGHTSHPDKQGLQDPSLENLKYPGLHTEHLVADSQVLQLL